MNFNGDLSKYHPADAIMFLSQLNLNGLFSIAANQELIAVSFGNGFIIDAHSKRGDAKILQALMYQRRVSPGQVRRIRQIQGETGMPIRSILAQLDFFPLAAVTDSLLIGIKEVLLEMFLLDSGSFHFTDTPVDTDDAKTSLDARMLSMRMAVQSDEFRDFEKSILSLDRELSLPAVTPADELTADAQVVLRLAANCRTLRQLFQKTPFDSHTAMEIVKDQLETGAIVLLPPTRKTNAQASGTYVDPLFGAFRQALKKLMLSRDPLKQLEALVTYCRGFYDGMLILTSRNGQLVHCKQMIRRNGQDFIQKTKKGRLGALDQDAVLLAVHRSGVGFFGQHFPSKLIDGLSGSPTGGECALIPVVSQGAMSLFLYAFYKKKFFGLSPQHYLELLSWMTTTRKQIAGHVETDSVARVSCPADPQAAPSGRLGPAQMVAAINDLPPLPTLVTRALELLADPGVDIKEIEAVIGKDQSLVSKLIRVSNSALYGSLIRVESLQPALTRLGAKTTKSLILASSMQNYFLKANPGVQAWGRSLWQHAAECGLAARRIAVAVGYDDPEKAFVGGVVHDIGKLVILLTAEGAYRQIENLKRRQQALSASEAEERILGTDHVAIGVRLMEKWKMPQSAQLCVQYHHCVDLAGEGRHLAAIAAYANHLSHLYGARPQPVTPEGQAVIDKLALCLDLSAAEKESLVASVATDFQDTSFF